MLQYISLAKSKGVVGDCESKRSWRQISELTDRNFIQGGMVWVMLQKKQKPNTVQDAIT